MRSLIGYWINALGLAALGFAVWTGFALFNGSGRIREAWDTGAYWTFGVPILLLALFAAGAASEPVSAARHGSSRSTRRSATRWPRRSSCQVAPTSACCR